jgi:dienelactone hydrolase
MLLSDSMIHYPPSATLSEWQAQRPLLQAEFRALLGELPPLFIPQARLIEIHPREGYQLEQFIFSNEAGDNISGVCLIPEGLTAPAPAVLYLHYHGNKYHLGVREMLQDRLSKPSIGVQLAQAGYVVLAIDAYGFGERQTVTIGQHQYTGGEAETALAKYFLWHGTSLWGMMLRDDLLALGYLLTRPEVDPKRIAAVGMSMGGSRATWLAALDERITCVIPIAQMTRWRHFLTSSPLNLHGIYYFLPGLLKSGLEMEHLVSLAAPRHQHILIGSHDPLSPINGVHKISAFARQVYQLYAADERFQTVIYPDIGHVYSDAMVADMLRGLIVAFALPTTD